MLGQTGISFPGNLDPSVVIDWSQVRQSFLDPTQSDDGVTYDSAGNIVPEVSVTATPVATPIWPLILIGGVLAYVILSQAKVFR